MKILLRSLLLIFSLFLLINSCSKDNPIPDVTKFTLIVTASEGGSVNDGGTYDEGTEVTITATPNEGYEFIGWEGNDSSNSDLTIFLNSNQTLNALFAVFVQGEVFNNKNKYLALGDSYTIGESVDVKQKWPVQLLDKLSKVNSEINELEIIAQTGWTAQQLITATAELTLEPPYGLVSLLIGVNNQFQGQLAENFRPSFIELIDRAVILSGNIKERVFVLSIPDWGATPFANSLERDEITKQINEFNNIIKYEADQRNIKFYNIKKKTI